MCGSVGVFFSGGSKRTRQFAMSHHCFVRNPAHQCCAAPMRAFCLLSLQAAPSKRRRASAAAAAGGDALSEGDVSDWAGGGGGATTDGGGGGGGGVGGSSSQRSGGGREDIKAVKDSLALMAAEVSLSKGNTEEAGKLLKALLSR